MLMGALTLPTPNQSFRVGKSSFNLTEIIISHIRKLDVLKWQSKLYISHSRCKREAPVARL